MLEQGSKANGKATGWFGRIKKQRKDDPLLSYMHHARNSEEHGIEDITKRMQPGQMTFTFREPFDPKAMGGLAISWGHTSAGQIVAHSTKPEAVSARSFNNPEIALVRVTDPMHSDYFDPPFEHLGILIHKQSPEVVGRLFVDYIAKLIDESRTFGV